MLTSLLPKFALTTVWNVHRKLDRVDVYMDEVHEVLGVPMGQMGVIKGIPQ